MRSSSVWLGTICTWRIAGGSWFLSVRLANRYALLVLILLGAAGAKADVYDFTLTGTGVSGTGSVTVDPSQCVAGECFLPADGNGSGIT